MQVKTIKSVIKKKMEEWVATIKDEKLAKDVLDELMVSGGCISSMLLNEPVNDYDVYIQDVNVLRRLVAYYSNEAPYSRVLDGGDKAKLVANIESEYGEKIIDITNRYAIALRNLKDDQIKLYFEGSYSGRRYNEDKPEADLNYDLVFMSPNAISLSNQVQIVIRFHGSPEEIHKNYDFIHATNYYTTEDGVVTNLAAMTSLLTKQLKYQGSLYPITSVIRAKKFIKRGFNINAGEYLKMMFQISELDLKNTDVLEDQLIGVDVAYFSLLIDIIRGKYDSNPDFSMSSSYLNELIDRVFSENDSEQ